MSNFVYWQACRTLECPMDILLLTGCGMGSIYPARRAKKVVGIQPSAISGKGKAPRSSADSPNYS